MDINIMEIIKRLINESLEFKGLSDTEIATIESLHPLSIKLSNDKILPKEFLQYTPKMSYLKNTENMLELNNKILVQKKQGGQQYIIIDTLEDNTIGNTISVVANVAPLKITLANNKTLDDNSLMIFSKELSYLRTTADKQEIGKKLITCRETGTGKYIFIAESE